MKDQYIEIQSLVCRLTLDIIVRTAFDCKFSAQKGDPDALEYLRNLNILADEFFRTFRKYVFPPLLSLW